MLHHRTSLLLAAWVGACVGPALGQSSPAGLVVVSAADHRSYIAPQSQASVLGTDLGNSNSLARQDPAGKLSTELAGTTVQICGEMAGIVSVGPSQITFVVPADLKPGRCPVLVATNDRILSGTADIRFVSPGLFTMSAGGAGRAAAVNAVTNKPDPFFVLTPDNASADKGTRVALFGTGFRNAVVNGRPDGNSATATYAMITTATGTSWPVAVEYIGAAPGLAGVDQINIALPAAIDRPGIVSFTLTVDSVRSNSVELNIASLSPPSVNGFTPDSGSPGSIVTIFGANFGTSAILAAGRVAVALKRPDGIRIAVSPVYVDSSQLRFVVPDLPLDDGTSYSGPATLCVEVDSATTCSSDFIVTPPLLSSAVPGDTFLTLVRAALQNGVANLNKLGATQVAQALSAQISDIVTRYTALIAAATSGNPETISFPQADGTQVFVQVDRAFVSRLDFLAASLQPILTDVASAAGSDTLQPGCITPQEQALQDTRDAYRQARAAAVAILRAAVVAPVTSHLGGCLGPAAESCATMAGASVTAAEAAIYMLTGLLYSPLLATMATETQPVFLDSLQIAPAALPSSAKSAVHSGSAVLLPLGQTTILNVQGHFVSIPPAAYPDQIVRNIVADAIRSVLPPKTGDVAIATCDVCLKMLEACPECATPLETLGSKLADDITSIVLNNVYTFLPPVPSVQSEATIPLTGATIYIGPPDTGEVTILPPCFTTPASVTGVAPTAGSYESFQFAADPSALLLSSEISTRGVPGNMFSILSVAVGPAAPPLRVQVDKSAYGNEEQAYVSGSGYPPYSAVALSISGESFPEKIEVIGFTDAFGRFGNFVPLYDIEKTGTYILSGFVPNSSIRASVSVSISSAKLAVQVTPQGGDWGSSPQTVSVRAPGAQRIYYSVNQALGSIPPSPAAPSAIAHDGVITGDSGSLQLSGTDEQFAAWVYTFVAEDEDGLGSLSAAYVFTIDLRSRLAHPQITGIRTTPDTPRSGQAFEFVISGSNFDSATAHVVFTGPGCSVGCMISNAQLAITANEVRGSVKLYGGRFTVTVLNGSTAASNVFLLNIGFNTPSVVAITTSPSPPVRGQLFGFTITGTDFDPENAIVLFAGPGCSAPTSPKITMPNNKLVSKSPIQLNGRLTLSDGCFNVTVQNGSDGAPSNPVPFTVSGARISGIETSPNPPVPGQVFSFLITGDNFDRTSATVIFDGPGCSSAAKLCSIPSGALSAISSTELSGSAILNGGTFVVTVQNGPGGAPSNNLPLTIGPPQIASISPVSVISGEQFTLAVTGASFDPSSVYVMLDGPGCTPCQIANGALTSKSGTSLSATGPILAVGTYMVAVQNGLNGPVSNSVPLTVSSPAPQLVSVTPASTSAGQAFTFTLVGSGFNPNTALVTFTGPGCTPCSLASNTLASKSATSLSGTGPALGVGTYTVAVQNGIAGTASNGVSLTVSNLSPAAAPQLASITPASTTSGQTFTFTIIGTGLDPRTAIVIFTGPGCTPCSVANSALATKSATSLSGVGPALAPGIYSISVQNASTGSVSNSVSLTISDSPPPAPQLSGLTTLPNPPISGQVFTFTITGSGFDANSAVVTFSGPGCTSPACVVPDSALTVKSATQLSGSATLAGDAFMVTVQNGRTGVPSNPLTVRTSSSRPVLTTITTSPAPPIAAQAFTFTITGTGFDPNGATVFFNGPGCGGRNTCNIPASALSSASSTQLSGTALLSFGSFDVTVLNGPIGNISNSLSLQVASSRPTLTTITTFPSPPSAGQAFTFTITGSGFDPSGATVFFNGPGCGASTTCIIGAGALFSTTDTQLSGTAVLASGTFMVTVLNGPVGNLSNGLNVVVSTSTVQISGMSPTSTASGSAFAFSINGSGFDPSSAVVVFSGPGCTPSVCTIANSALTIRSPTSLSGLGPALTAGSYTVTVQNVATGMSSNAWPLVVSGQGGTAPQLSGVTTIPSSPINQQAFTLAVSGTGFDPATALLSLSGPGCAPTPCTIGNAALVTKTATQLSGAITLAAGSFVVNVQNGPGGAASNSMSIGVGPQLTGIVPTSAVAGTQFTFAISGSGFDPTSALVTFNGPNCAPCTIPNGDLTSKTSTALSGSATLAAAGAFTITVQNGPNMVPSNSLILAVSSSGSAPQLGMFTTAPNPPVNQQGFTFTITGTGFDPNTAVVTFSGPGCTPCTVANGSLTSKSASQLIGPASLASTGAFAATVQNGPNGVPSNGMTFTVISTTTAPQISGITPTSATAGQAFTFTITGSGFDPASLLVNFGGGTVSSLSLTTKSATQIVGNVTLTGASYTVTVQNGAGGTPSNSVTLNVSGAVAAPQISSISPISATAGQPVTFTITGTGFDPATVIVNFTGGTASNLSLTAKSATQLVGSVTLTAGSYTITVQNGSAGASSNGMVFTVSSSGGGGGPQLAGVSGGSSLVHGQAGGLILFGSGFDPNSSEVLFSGPNCTPSACTVSNITVNPSKTAIIVYWTPPTSGNFTVQVRNGSGAAPSNSLQLTVQ